MIWKSAGALALALAMAQPAAAQLGSPSTAALGMGDNYTAAARGFSAIAWNPANLGLSGNPGASFQFLTLRGLVGVDPVTLTDIAERGGEIVPVGVKNSWQSAIDAHGGEQGTSGFDGNWLSLQIGHFGFQASTSGRAIANFSPGIARLLMFGNTDENGTPQTIDLSNSSMDVNAFSTGAVGFALPFSLNSPTSRVTFGVTAKYTMGHFMAMGDESTGSASADPTQVQLRFPVIHTSVDDDSEQGFQANNGSGFGLDAGVAFESNKLTLGAAVKNIVNSFEWDADRLYFREGELLLNQDTTSSNFDSEPLSVARTRTGANAVPASLLARVDAQKFKPIVALGAMYRVSPKLRATGDVRVGSSEGIQVGPQTHAGAGVEYRLMSWLPLRVGAAYIKMDDDNTGSQLGGGLGLDLAGFNLAGSVQRRSTDLGHDTIVMLTILSRGM
jgi:hypothetical protein